MKIKTVSGYRFCPDDLKVLGRKQGISAFLRTRNGADFIEAAIRSHIDFYDEIVAVYNQCDDDTDLILARLAREFGSKLRVFHYTDRVAPLGSKEHAETSEDSPHSMANFSNFAMSQTRYNIVVKLDDDHLAIPSNIRALVTDLRAGHLDKTTMQCFSGLNVARDANGALGIPEHDPVSGGGDIGYFHISEETYFRHDKRFERFGHGDLNRVFTGYQYWHLKFLKAGEGFENYELSENPNSRYAKKRARFQKTRLLPLRDAGRTLKPSIADRIAAQLSDKNHLKVDRNLAASQTFTDKTLEQAMDRLSPGWRDIPGLQVPQ